MSSKTGAIRIGTAGWNVPRRYAEEVSSSGTHLERYAQTLHCVEINSSFYRPHQLKTWQRWAAATPANFRFSVKAPKSITHETRLRNCGKHLAAFFAQLAGLGEKLGPILFQLPPKQTFDDAIARGFFTTVRELHTGPVALEPRNAAWFTPPAARLLRDYQITCVAADPPQGSLLAARPSGYPALRYYRLHGAPRTYWSRYSEDQLAALAADIEANPNSETWVIFDNTAAGEAFGNALSFQKLLSPV
jgi:uncharacterized protein YecE (DUF72 family)